MSKYENFLNNENESFNPLTSDESLIMELTPKKKAFVINKILPMMPIALLWLVFDSILIVSAFVQFKTNVWIGLIMLAFLAVHLIPFWTWLGTVLTAGKVWENTKYYVTDKRIIIQSGFVAKNFQSVYYKEIKNVNLHIGIVDKMLSVGDVYFNTNGLMNNAFLDIENAQQVYQHVQKIVLDIQTDIEYPNAYRPSENPGYNTKYNG